MTDRRVFPNSPDAVTLARRFTAERTQPLSAEVAESAALIVSELATNSVRHAHTGFDVAIEVFDDRVRISVTDSGEGEPHIRSPRPNEVSGRGLQIVEHLADDWGVESEVPGVGKTVWFTLNLVAS